MYDLSKFAGNLARHAPSSTLSGLQVDVHSCCAYRRPAQSGATRPPRRPGSRILLNSYKGNSDQGTRDPSGVKTGPFQGRALALIARVGGGVIVFAAHVGAEVGDDRATHWAGLGAALRAARRCRAMMAVGAMTGVVAAAAAARRTAGGGVAPGRAGLLVSAAALLTGFERALPLHAHILAKTRPQTSLPPAEFNRFRFSAVGRLHYT